MDTWSYGCLGNRAMYMRLCVTDRSDCCWWVIHRDSGGFSLFQGQAVTRGGGGREPALVVLWQ